MNSIVFRQDTFTPVLFQQHTFTCTSSVCKAVLYLSTEVLHSIKTLTLWIRLGTVKSLIHVYYATEAANIT